MVFTSVREFKIQATKFLNSGEKVVVTRYGKPIAVLLPVRAKSPEALFLELRAVLNEARITKKEALKTLDQVRKEVYR